MKQLKKTLTNTDLSKLAKKYNVKLNGIYMKDELNENNLTDGNYIMNLQNHDQGGTHWTAFIKHGQNIFYCDSYGQYPPQNEFNLFNKFHHIYILAEDLQDYNSELCGWFALFFIIWMNKKSGLSRFKSYLNNFSHNILKKMIQY